MAELRYQHTQAVRTQLAATYAPATANKMLAALRGVLQQCRKLKLMSAGDAADAADVSGRSAYARTNDPGADGEGVWSWPPDAEVKSCGDEPRGDGGKQARSPGRARHKR